ncbi:hypothetical protein ACFQ05_21585 [Amycolatopsis umgeniensis]|uniref:Uncharacterized protein n=1 Tax=Amycolatopsis umgeniensis TaxID=336628 RepID=A0A841BHW7_9PSEU|nr:hypothetical protein [Amycolatopsis umgeniensis]MBB5858213.1 hypothetical protein [Amycolatopsis umgeniensis]
MRSAPEADVVGDRLTSRLAAQAVRTADQVKQTVRRADRSGKMPIFMLDPEQAELDGITEAPAGRAGELVPALAYALAKRP